MPRKKKNTESEIQKEAEKPFAELRNKPFNYEPKSFKHESEAFYGGFGDDYLIRDNPELHTPGRNVLRFNNLMGYRIPYQEFGRYIYMREPIRLCQVAWNEVPVFFQTIEVMTELANTGVKLFKGSDKGKKFFTSWFSTFNLFNFTEKFFRETWLSGNVFVYRYDGSIKSNKLNKFIFGEHAMKELKEAKAAKSIDIPVRYIILNPAFVCLFNDLDLNNIPEYYWMTDTSTRNQLQRLVKDGTNLDLSKETKNILDNNITEAKLNSDQLYPFFYKKQDYQPFATPMGYRVLDDINIKLEFKKCDMVVSKTVESIITLVKHGTEDKDGNLIVNPMVAGALEKMFLGTKQTGRTIVTTNDTNIDFVIPDLNKVVGPEKYKKIDEDINDGLMNLFFGEQKFANIMVKLRVFVKKLEYVQNMFLNDFLIPEMKRVGKAAGYKPEDIPIPKFKAIQLDDPSNANRIITQLLQLGVLTAKDGTEAIDTGLMPEYDDLLENQVDYTAKRAKGLFMPLVGASMQDGTAGGTSTNPNQAGRPGGTKSPKKVSKPAFKGGSNAKYQYDILKFRENVSLALDAEASVQSGYKTKYNKENLSEEDRAEIKIITEHLTTNEHPSKWEESISSYLEELPTPNMENISLIEEIKEQEDLDSYSAALLMWSKRE